MKEGMTSKVIIVNVSGGAVEARQDLSREDIISSFAAW